MFKIKPLNSQFNPVDLNHLSEKGRMDVSANDKAAMYLEDELENIRERFDNGEMNAFGPNQSKILKQFQEIRHFQAQLAMKQVAMLGDMM